MSSLRRCALVFLLLWLPLRAVAGELLHAHEAAGSEEISHLTHDGTSTPADDGSTCVQCAVAHGFCHLVLNPGVVSSTFLALAEPAATRYLPTQPVPLAGLGADCIDRPPLSRA
ncbi:MAG TPA: hypothetical protein PLZ79_03625 [Burkholderiales bacterium]|nr:hypothetical protein [Betaproteobacteria bacterium]HQR52333.1 hypothetical protein [Burkholderiales bacterium]